jgi:hypothetical protein
MNQIALEKGRLEGKKEKKNDNDNWLYL